MREAGRRLIGSRDLRRVRSEREEFNEHGDCTESDASLDVWRSRGDVDNHGHLIGGSRRRFDCDCILLTIEIRKRRRWHESEVEKMLMVQGKVHNRTLLSGCDAVWSLVPAVAMLRSVMRCIQLPRSTWGCSSEATSRNESCVTEQNETSSFKLQVLQSIEAKQ